MYRCQRPHRDSSVRVSVVMVGSVNSPAVHSLPVRWLLSSLDISGSSEFWGSLLCTATYILVIDYIYSDRAWMDFDFNFCGPIAKRTHRRELKSVCFINEQIQVCEGILCSFCCYEETLTSSDVGQGLLTYPSGCSPTLRKSEQALPHGSSIKTKS